MAIFRWKSSLIGLALLVFALGIGMSGCGGTTTCSLDFLDSSTQEICDNQAAAAGCDTPAEWSALTQFCTGHNCTDCPGTGTTE